MNSARVVLLLCVAQFEIIFIFSLHENRRKKNKRYQQKCIKTVLWTVVIFFSNNIEIICSCACKKNKSKAKENKKKSTNNNHGYSFALSGHKKKNKINTHHSSTCLMRWCCAHTYTQHLLIYEVRLASGNTVVIEYKYFF